MSIHLTPEEEQHIVERRRALERETYFREGLEAAARKAEAWADECGKGSGRGGTANGYHNLAFAIRSIRK